MKHLFEVHYPARTQPSAPSTHYHSSLLGSSFAPFAEQERAGLWIGNRNARARQLGLLPFSPTRDLQTEEPNTSPRGSQEQEAVRQSVGANHSGIGPTGTSADPAAMQTLVPTDLGSPRLTVGPLRVQGSSPPTGNGNTAQSLELSRVETWLRARLTASAPACLLLLPSSPLIGCKQPPSWQNPHLGLEAPRLSSRRAPN